MKADTRALLKVIGWSFVLAIVVVAVAVAAVVGWIKQESAPQWMLGIIMVGGILLALWYGPALRRSDRSKTEPDEAGADDDSSG
jgi:arginine exporter protein ArgO